MVKARILKIINGFDGRDETSQAHDRTYLLGYIHAKEDDGMEDEAKEIRELCKKHNVGGVLGC